jgi:hypothetical protein
MRRVTVRALEVALVPTLALGLALALAPGQAVLEVRVWLLIVLAGGLLSIVGAIRQGYPPAPSLFDAALTRPQPKQHVFPTLARLEREVSMATGSAYDLHFRLRPTLREVTRGLLLSRRGIDLDRQQERARTALGEETWELVRADRPTPAEHRGPGIAPDALARVLASLEGL